MGKEKEAPEEKPAENGTEENKKEEDEKPTENGHIDAESKKEEKEREDEEDGEDGEESEEEPAPGILDKPIEILTTKRERRSTEFLANNRKVEEAPPEELDYTKGKGTMIKDIPYVLWQINNADTEDLFVLHKLMYRKNAKRQLVKTNIRNFCGFPFEKTDKMYKSAVYLAWRLIIPGLRWINGVLGLEKSFDKDKMRNDLLEFLMHPKDTGMKIPNAKTPKSAKKKTKSKTPKKKSTPKVKKTKDASGSDVSEASDSDASDSEEKEEKPAKSPKKKPTPKKKPAKATPVKIAMPMKKKSASKKRKSIEKSDESEDEEPLVKKKKGPPTDAELKKVVGTILKDADLEQVTMKNVVKQIYDKYSSFDLTSRKDYIKTCVKELIS